MPLQAALVHRQRARDRARRDAVLVEQGACCRSRETRRSRLLAGHGSARQISEPLVGRTCFPQRVDAVPPCCEVIPNMLLRDRTATARAVRESAAPRGTDVANVIPALRDRDIGPMGGPEASIPVPRPGAAGRVAGERSKEAHHPAGEHGDHDGRDEADHPRIEREASGRPLHGGRFAGAHEEVLHDAQVEVDPTTYRLTDRDGVVGIRPPSVLEEENLATNPGTEGCPPATASPCRSQRGVGLAMKQAFIE